MRKLWRLLKYFLLKLFRRKRAVEAVELPALSEDLEAELGLVDWSQRDVLVGSLGSREQLADNLQWNYYYVPAYHIDTGDLPIRYVAIYQSWNLFGEDGGIRCYGEVAGVEKVERRKIRFPVVRDNGEELYYCFYVKQWKTLADPIALRDAWVSEPRFTNSFLLRHCAHSFELFGIRSEQDFRLAVCLREILDGADTPFAYRVTPERSLVLRKGKLAVRDHNGKVLDSLSLTNVRETPGSALQRIKWALRR